MLGNRSPIYDTLLILHVLVGMIGYGAVVFSGVFSRKLLREGPTESTLKYFDGSINIPGMFVGLVPVFGVIVLLVGKRNLPDLTKGWFDLAVAIWIISGAVAFMRIFPAERRLHQAILAESENVGIIAKAISVASGVCALLYVAAFYLMLFKPRL